MNNNIFEEYNIQNTVEANPSPKSEFNKIEIKNNDNVSSNMLYFEQFENGLKNQNLQKNIEKSQKNNKKTAKNPSNQTNFFKIISTFVFACAMIVIVLPSIHLPIFSRIFSPQSNVYATPKYISNIDITYSKDKTNKYLGIKITEDKSFSNFDSLFIKIENLTKTHSDYSIIPKKYLDSSTALFTLSLTKPEELFTLKIYCSTTDSEIKKNESVVKDEITYYLVYEHDSYINF